MTLGLLAMEVALLLPSTLQNPEDLGPWIRPSIAQKQDCNSLPSLILSSP